MAGLVQWMDRARISLYIDEIETYRACPSSRDRCSSGSVAWSPRPLASFAPASSARQLCGPPAPHQFRALGPPLRWPAFVPGRRGRMLQGGTLTDAGGQPYVEFSGWNGP